jgi:hypothetical protein
MRNTPSLMLLLPAVAGALLGTPACARAGETDRWQALFAAVPALPEAPAGALAKIAGHRVDGRIRVEVADATLRTLQRDVDELYETTARGSSAQVQRRLAEVNQDPELARLGGRIDEVLGLEHPTGKPPAADELKKLNQELEPLIGSGATSRDAPPVPMSAIASYRLELQRTPPHPAQLYQRLFEQQRRYAQQHAQADRDAMARRAGPAAAALARALVERHQALARQQLADATAMYSEARDTFRPRFERMAQLARAAESRNASPAERVQAYALFKAYVEMLLTLERETLQDVGFWAGIRARPVLTEIPTDSAQSLYEHVLAPDIELHGDGELATAGPHYPGGRAIVVGLPPGLR